MSELRTDNSYSVFSETIKNSTWCGYVWLVSHHTFVSVKLTLHANATPLFTPRLGTELRPSEATRSRECLPYAFPLKVS